MQVASLCGYCNGVNDESELLLGVELIHHMKRAENVQG